MTTPVLKPLGPGYPPDFVEEVLARALAVAAPGRAYGIAGLQGTGKSTLAAQVAALAGARGLKAAVLSIDDVYLDRPQRLALAARVHPLLATRGPPGTHDVGLALRTLDALARGPAALPAFDKLSDARLPESAWPVAPGPADVVLLEGWFLRVPPQDEAALAAHLNALERDEDGEGTWRRFCNRALADYTPLWARLGGLLFLQGPGFEVVPSWRWEQEETLALANPGRRAMTRAEVERFVLFFERVSRHALAVLPGLADWTVQLDAERRRRG